MPAQGFLGDLPVADAAEGGGRAGEALFDDLVAEADGLEHLGAAVAGERADAHAGHDLEQAGLDGLLEVFLGLCGRGRLGELALGGQLADGGEREVGIDGVGPIAGEAGDMVHLVRLGGLDHDIAFQAHAGADELVLDGAEGEQHRDGGAVGCEPAVGEDDDPGSVHLHGVEGALRQFVHGGGERLGAGLGLEQRGQPHDGVAEERHGRQGLHLVVEQDR